MFKGFDDSESLTPVPDAFFRTLLAQITDLDELKVTLYVLWRVEHTEGASHPVSREDIAADQAFMQGLDAAGLDSGLEKAVRRGSLLRAQSDLGGPDFLNSPRGRAAAEALSKGDRSAAARSASAPPRVRTNIFKLYEENIGPLTPLIADALKDAENTYPEEWIAEAMEQAVKRNIRNWNYVAKMLLHRKEEGKHEGKTQQNAGKGSERYTKSEFSEYLDKD